MLADQNENACRSLRRIELAINNEISRLSDKKKERLAERQRAEGTIHELELDLARIGDEFNLSGSDIIGMFTGSRWRQAIAMLQTINSASTISQVENLLRKRKELEARLSDLQAEIVAVTYEIIQKNRERDANIEEQRQLGCPKRPY
ncbi:hypothetical protein FF124_09545 [Martelella lutilitoris]|uniref:Uncharacterized protein n=1 Tax=Martelella lutilitoris TaxID=2583532 RepID=A0A5C4JR65_9HYPH|nr:hypothetical protein [Martelella lutilitoris]TNB47828.1 hypothetical protein FF124_09545 [Martelella lutilitoris]